MRNRTREPRIYELLTILSPDVVEEEIPGAVDRIAGYVTASGGTVEDTSRESPWGRRRLAYPIRNAGRDVRDGYYTLYRVNLAPDRIEELERELKLNTQVIRYLVTHHTPKAPDPRAIEDAEIAAEDAAADAYAAAQAEAARLASRPAPAPDTAEDDAADAYAAAQAEAARLASQPVEVPAALGTEAADQETSPQSAEHSAPTVATSVTVDEPAAPEDASSVEVSTDVIAPGTESAVSDAEPTAEPEEA